MLLQSIPLRVFIFFILILPIVGCLDVNEYSNATVSKDQEFAIPIFNSKMSINSLAERVNNGSATVKIGPDGKLTVFYNGEVVRNKSTELFPAIPGLVEFPLLDTTALVPLPFDARYTISKAVFGKTNIFFRLEQEQTGIYYIKMTLPQLSKNGVVWSKDYKVLFGSPGQSVTTELTDLEGWTILPDDNNIKFVYEAYNSIGQRLKMDSIAMRVDELVFDYVEGYFSKQTFEIDGNNIGVGIFENWVSGGLDFDNPKMNISVENAFGFPVRARFNKISLTTLNGQTFDLMSDYINTGIDFDYPKVEEIGAVKYSSFSFSKENSNIREIFNDKVVNVTYDIDALANPDDDTSILNFVDTTSYFSVNVAIEIPLLGSANDFVLKQETALDLSELSDVESATFKAITINEFPADILIQIYFKDANGAVLDSMFMSGPLSMESAPLGADLKTTSATEKTTFEEINNVKLNKILGAVKVETRVYLDNTDVTNENLWIYDDYEIGVRLGAIAKLK